MQTSVTPETPVIPVSPVTPIPASRLSGLAAVSPWANLYVTPGVDSLIRRESTPGGEMPPRSSLKATPYSVSKEILFVNRAAAVRRLHNSTR